MAMDREERVAWLQDHLKKKRFRHSLAVEAEAGAMAARFGLDEEKARRAGLAHDAAKNLSTDDQRAAMEADGFEADEYFRLSPSLYHGPAGAWVARQIMGEEDPEVLDAIRWHTIPSTDPQPLAKVLLIADMIEPDRDFPGVRELRAAAARDLDEAFLLALASPMIFELQKMHIVHPNTLTVYNRMLALKTGRQNDTI